MDTSLASTMETVFQNMEMEEISEFYNVIKKLGQGTYGQVVLAEDKTTGEPVAVKLLRKDRTELDTFLSELSLSVSLSEYPGIISTYPISIETTSYYIMTQELAVAGTLHDIIHGEDGIQEDVVKRCAAQISGALDYMHGRGLVHRDLKPDNVLLMDKDCYHIKLSDFGMTQHAGSLVSAMTNIIPYMSPELCGLQHEEYLVLDPSIDSWAFGVLLYVALTGYFPWLKASESDIMYQNFISWQESPNFTPSPTCWETLTSEALGLFSGFFTRDPCSRHSPLSVLDYLHLPWKADVLEYFTQVAGEEEVLEVDFVDENQQFEFIIIQDQEDESSSVAVEDCSPVLMIITEHNTLILGCEVELP